MSTQSPAYIYALTDQGVIRYVGQTRDLESRKARHKRRYPVLDFKIIRSVPQSAASRIERQVIAACSKKRCMLNWNNYCPKPVASSVHWTEVMWIETGEIIRSVSEAFRRWPLAMSKAKFRKRLLSRERVAVAPGVTLKVSWHFPTRRQLRFHPMR